MHHYHLTVLIFLVALQGFAQSGYSFGARHAGLAGASSTISDGFSLFNNPAGLGDLSDRYAFAGYQSRFGIKELQTVVAGGTYASKPGTFGASFYKFGDDNFSQQKIGLAFANKIQFISLGVGLDLIQYSINEVGTRQALSIQFGGIAQITKALLFGAHIFNLSQSQIGRESEEPLPTIMKAGLSFRPSDELMLNAEIEKELVFREVFKTGIEYQVIKKVFARTGIRTNPITGTFGVGFYPKKFQFDYAFSNNANLGGIHDLTIAYSFK
ncbi:MAG: hypothetical protein AAF789_11940 [Bacteroidota bacterium]